MAWLTDPYAYDFMQRALFAGVLVGALAPAVGVWVVLRRMSYLGDAMSHGVLGGVALAYLAGASITLGALGAGLLMAALIAVLSAHPRLREDAIIGIVGVALFAGGLLLIARADAGAVDLAHFLLGSVTTVSAADLRVDVLLGAVAAVGLALLFGDLRSSTLDPLHAATVGVPVGRVGAALTVVLAVVVVLCLQTVGLLLSVALLVVPAASARLWTSTALGMTVVASAAGVAATAVGLTASWHLATPPGATIALACVAVLVASFLATRPRRVAAVPGHLAGAR